MQMNTQFHPRTLFELLLTSLLDRRQSALRHTNGVIAMTVVPDDTLDAANVRANHHRRWTLDLRSDGGPLLMRGAGSPAPDVSIVLTRAALFEAMAGKLDPMAAVRDRTAHLEGDRRVLIRFARLLGGPTKKECTELRVPRGGVMLRTVT